MMSTNTNNNRKRNNNNNVVSSRYSLSTKYHRTLHGVAVVVVVLTTLLLSLSLSSSPVSVMAWTSSVPTTTSTTSTKAATKSLQLRPHHNHQLHPSSSPVVALFQSSNVKVLEPENIPASTDSTTSTTSTNLQDYLPTTTTTTTSDSIVNDDDVLDEEYKKGFAIISFITLLNASLSPVWHTVFEGGHGPPPLFLNAIVSMVAFIGLVLGSPFLDKNVETTSALASTKTDEDDQEETTKWSAKSFRGGIELGFWKGLGTTCHIYGMALTTANHGAFLLQLTTLIVPILQGIRGERIPKQIQLAVGLALAGIVAFTQDPSGSAGAGAVALDPAQVQLGDALVLGAAFFYSLYDIQTFYWGREVPRTELVTIKVGFQAVLSVLLCAAVARDDVMQYFSAGPNWSIMIPTVLWSGLIVNALATFLQVGGMQSVGPTRAQTIFASQPLWASILNYAFIGEIMGTQGLVGGGAFLGALFLAATAEAPKPVTNSSEGSSS